MESEDFNREEGAEEDEEGDEEAVGGEEEGESVDVGGRHFLRGGLVTEMVVVRGGEGRGGVGRCAALLYLLWGWVGTDADSFRCAGYWRSPKSPVD